MSFRLQFGKRYRARRDDGDAVRHLRKYIGQTSEKTEATGARSDCARPSQWLGDADSMGEREIVSEWVRMLEPIKNCFIRSTLSFGINIKRLSI